MKIRKEKLKNLQYEAFLKGKLSIWENVFIDFMAKTKNQLAWLANIIFTLWFLYNLA